VAKIEVVKLEVKKFETALIGIEKAISEFIKGKLTGQQLSNIILKAEPVIDSAVKFIQNQLGNSIYFPPNTYDPYHAIVQFQAATWPALQKASAPIPTLLKKIAKKPEKKFVLKIWSGGFFGGGLYGHILEARNMIGVTLRK
jgi:hypothetical protein